MLESPAPSGARSQRTVRTRVGAAASAGIVAVSALAVTGVAAANPSVVTSDATLSAQDAWVSEQLEEMTLEEKVGQLFMTYAYGETADTDDPDDVEANQEWLGVDNGAELIDTYQVGGIIYFAWSNNVNDPEQIAGLSNGLQEEAVAQPSETPLLVSTDQEHGVVTRVGPPATQFPGNMALGAVGDADAAYEAGLIAGHELRAVGINENFAPTADVNVNPENPVIGVRSFSSDPQLTAELTAAQVEGYQDVDGVTSTAKHFPGHGNTDQDSHDELPTIPHTYEEWQEIDAPPFESAFESDLDSIMTAHIQFPALDDSMDPATLSKPIMTDLLREEMGFDGLVVTDSLSMEGVRELYDDEEIPVLALQAGVDMLLMPPDLDLAYNAVLDAVADGELTEDRIDESVQRILHLKSERGIVDDPFVDPDAVDDVVGTPEHLQAAQDITDRSTTLVKNDGVLPLDGDSGDVLVTGTDGTDPTESAEDASVTVVDDLSDALAERGLDSASLPTGPDPDQAAIDEVVAAAEDRDFAVVTTSNAFDVETNPGQAALVEALQAADTPVVAVAVNTPYDVAQMTEVEAYVAAYSTTAPAVESLADVLFAEVDPSGTLPVTIPEADDPDTPLYEFGHGLSYDD